MGVQDPFNLRKWTLLTEAISIVIGVSLFLYACDNLEATKERETMEVTKTNSIPNYAIPPIDRSAPLKTETATFALG